MIEKGNNKKTLLIISGPRDDYLFPGAEAN